MPHSTSTAAPPMKPFSRSLQKDLDVAAADDDGKQYSADDDGKQYSADDGSGKQNSERGVRWPSRLFYLALIYTVFWALVFYHHFSTSVQQSGSAVVGAPAVLQLKPAAFFPVPRFFRRDPCAGRYVYMYDLPPRFNADLVRDCRRIPASSDVCKDVSNDGFGPPITGGGVGGSLPEQGAYDTDQFMLSVIFHARMRQYECLTADPAAATVVYIPFYAGLDAAIHLGNKDLAARDALSRDLLDWLVQRPEWRAMEGRDHLLVAGRGTWDFLRSPDAVGWGNTLMTYNPAIRNATFLNTEASARHGNDFAVPFPSHFHPSSDAEVTAWQDRMRRLDRAWLWCFAGWPRARGSGMGPERAEIIQQCGNSSRCSLLGKSTPGYYVPGHAMRLLESAEFCMQPRGDGYTRKSTFDSILAGCIPVFFHPVSAYLQYTWHLPRDYRSYSVYVHHADVVARNASIEEVLRRIPPEKVARMRERVIQLIPTVMYRHPAAKGVTFKDAFDVTLERVVDRVAKRRRAAAQGRQYVDSVDGADSWKYDLLEDGQTRVGPHEFDQYLH